MNFPLSIDDVSLWLTVTALILLITSELLYALPEFLSRITLDKTIIRLMAIGCGCVAGMS